MSYTCKKCGWTGEPNGRQRCLRCAKERTAKWRLENPDKVRTQQKIGAQRRRGLRRVNRELLEALSNLLKCCEAQPEWSDLTDRVDDEGSPFPSAPWIAARRAIAKARGLEGGAK